MAKISGIMPAAFKEKDAMRGPMFLTAGTENTTRSTPPSSLKEATSPNSSPIEASEKNAMCLLAKAGMEAQAATKESTRRLVSERSIILEASCWSPHANLSLSLSMRLMPSSSPRSPWFKGRGAFSTSIMDLDIMLMSIA